MKNPDAYDNQGYLEKVITLEQRNSIIKGRIKHLKVEIKNFKNIIDLNNAELMLRGK